jgi:NitT/TauT family transport system permease protein
VSEPITVPIDHAAQPEPARVGEERRTSGRWRRRLGEAILSSASPVAFLLVWEAASRAGWLSRLFFPAPSSILTTLVTLIGSGELWLHLSVSLRRVAVGFVLGVAPALVLGLAMGWSARVRAVFEPLIAALLPIPKLVVLPIIMVIFGVGEPSKIVLVAVGAFFPVVINAAAGVTGVRRVYFEVARNYGATRWQKFWRVVLPGSLPMVFAGLRLAFGMALLMVVASEFVAARHGIGALIWLSWETLRTDRLYAGIVSWSAVGLLSSAGLGSLQRAIIRWR